MTKPSRPREAADDETGAAQAYGLKPRSARPRSIGRPRSSASRTAVLLAAYQLLVEGGLPAFNIEAVAARSGVAKTTIYRSWSTKGKLAFDSFLEAYQPTLTYDLSLAPAEGLHALIASLVTALSGPAAKLTTSIIAEAQRDEEVRSLFRDQFSAPLRAKSENLIRIGMAAGEFRADLDPTKVIDAFVGAVYLRLIFGLPIGPAWADGLTDTLLHGCVEAKPTIPAGSRSRSGRTARRPDRSEKLNEQ